MLMSFKFEGIPGVRTIERTLNSDINILTGRNGCGKTTVLKLLWYLTSGNIEVALSEVAFAKAYVKTSTFSIFVEKVTGGANVHINIAGEQHLLNQEFDEDGDTDDHHIMEANEMTASLGSSIFFPTFRRIEGGFTLRPPTRPRNVPPPYFAQTRGVKIAIDEALSNLSAKLSVEDHTFVASLSTGDVVNVLLTRYNKATESANDLQSTESEAIIGRIKQYKRDTAGDTGATKRHSAESLIDEIQSSIESLEIGRSAFFSPINAISETITGLFKKKGIALGTRLNFGDAANAVSSDLLSAGEKQMLSFLCYNALRDNAAIFIDEPELSLHSDWQRQLFPLLLGQKTNNQFLIATHSPFIYTKYPEKEIVLSEDKGE